MTGHHLLRSLQSSCYPSSFSFRRHLLPIKPTTTAPLCPMFGDPLLHHLASPQWKVLDSSRSLTTQLCLFYLRLPYACSTRGHQCTGLYRVSASPPRNSPSEIAGLLGWRFLTYAVVGKSSTLLGPHHYASRGAATAASCSCYPYGAAVSMTMYIYQHAYILDALVCNATATHPSPFRSSSPTRA
ncbi:hypothetical protein ZWY2020_005105 [Hordeum vulgare]|nr:hypothetical protein ZWY2020_005105 [Hordeum vulgare]